MSTWSVDAVNLPDHATNPIHTDAGGRAAGFEGALVAGVTTYAYMTHPAAAADGRGWGLDWVRSGGAELRLAAPVLDGDRIDCVPVTGDPVDGSSGDASGIVSIEARVGAEVRASMAVWAGGAAPEVRGGEVLEPIDVVLDESWLDYGERAGDDLGLYREQGIIHPVVCPRLANDVFHNQLVSGAWIHTRSRIQHLALIPVGALAHVETTVFRRFATRSGERAIADVSISIDGEPVAQIEHEALISLTR